MYTHMTIWFQSILWITYNDKPTNGRVQLSLGHTKGTVVADKDFGFWLVHSVPNFPKLPYQNNSYSYPNTGVLYGQSFLCVSMMAHELDNVGVYSIGCWTVAIVTSFLLVKQFNKIRNTIVNYVGKRYSNMRM